jgi:hypothetical protein
MSAKIKILKNIPTQIASDKTLKKAFETFFYLKHHYDNGVVLNISKNIKTIAEQCQISERTFWTRLALLKSNKLAKKTPGGILLASWDDICEKFNVKKYYYYVKYEKIVQLELVLEAKAILEAKKRMQAAYKIKVNKNPELREALCNITGSDIFSRRAVLSCVIKAFTNPELYTKDEIEMLNAYNSDDNMNTYRIAEIFNNRRSSSSGTYTKRKLAKVGLLQFEHRRFKSEPRVRKTTIGCVYYSRPQKLTFAIMPDLVEII